MNLFTHINFNQGVRVFILLVILMSPTQKLNMDCSSPLLLLLIALQFSHQVACQSGSGSDSELESGSGDDTVTGGINDYLPFQYLGTTMGTNRQCLKRRLDGASPAINIPLGFPIGTSIQSKAYVSSICIEFKDLQLIFS